MARSSARASTQRPRARWLALAGELLRLPFGGRDVGRRLRTVRGQTRDRLPDSRDGGLAARELLYRLQFVEGSDAREAIPGVHQAGRGPIRSEFG